MCLYVFKIHNQETKRISMNSILRWRSHKWNFPFYDPIRATPFQFTWLESIPSSWCFALSSYFYQHVAYKDLKTLLGWFLSKIIRIKKKKSIAARFTWMYGKVVSISPKLKLKLEVCLVHNWGIDQLSKHCLFFK